MKYAGILSQILLFIQPAHNMGNQNISLNDSQDDIHLSSVSELVAAYFHRSLPDKYVKQLKYRSFK